MKRADLLKVVPGVHRATHRIALFLDRTVPPLALTQGEAHLLTHLLEAGPSTVGALHVAFAHKRSSLTSYLDRLAQRGFIERSVHAGDRRSFLVSLTASGSTAARRVHARLARLESSALEGLIDRDLRGFHAVLQGLVQQAGAR